MEHGSLMVLTGVVTEYLSLSKLVCFIFRISCHFMDVHKCSLRISEPNASQVARKSFM